MIGLSLRFCWFEILVIFSFRCWELDAGVMLDGAAADVKGFG